MKNQVRKTPWFFDLLSHKSKYSTLRVSRLYRLSGRSEYEEVFLLFIVRK